MSEEEHILNLYNEYRSFCPLSDEYDKALWAFFRLHWNYNSNRIEGNTLTYNETEALLITGTEPLRLKKDIREMKAHDLAITHLINLSKDERPITESDIRDLNKITLKEPYFIQTETADGNITRKEIIPGNYKTLPNHVRLRGGGMHKFANPENVPVRMAKTVKNIHDFIAAPDNDPSEFLANLHQDFIQTHPFDDGNGRVVRMLINYVCLKLGWPPIIIKDEKKSNYLAALEQADKGDISILIQLMRRELEWSVNKAIKAAKGEAFAEPDDILKEIDLFVRDNQSEFDGKGRTVEQKKRIYNELVLPIMDKLAKAINKFKPLFASSNPPFNKRLSERIGQGTYFNQKNNYATSGKLNEFIPGNSNRNISSRLNLTFGQSKFELIITLRFHDFSGSEKSRLRWHKFTFPLNEYDAVFTEKIINSFTDKIIRFILNIVNDYKDEAQRNL